MRPPRLTVARLMIAVAVVAASFWWLYARNQRRTEQSFVLAYSIQADHNRRMAQAAQAYVPDLETSIACKLGTEKSREDPYPTVSVEQAKLDINRYRALAEHHRGLVKLYEQAAAHPWDPAPVEPPRPW